MGCFGMEGIHQMTMSRTSLLCASFVLRTGFLQGNPASQPSLQSLLDAIFLPALKFEPPILEPAGIWGQSRSTTALLWHMRVMRRMDIRSGGFESNGLEAFNGTDRDRDGLGVFGTGTDVLETAVRGVWGVRGDSTNTASAGTSSPSFRQSHSSVARFCVFSDDTSKGDEPELAEGALETSDRALDRTGPRPAGAADSTPRWIGLRLLQIESVSSAGTGPATIDGVLAE
ncbi:hypothetical protein EDC04DRAFT_3092092 [Pisolithus marmoratus]|nr:hypothetical protein EDC04DRAFT_3092092 [Pisolithus marmoratus]